MEKNPYINFDDFVPFKATILDNQTQVRPGDYYNSIRI